MCGTSASRTAVRRYGRVATGAVPAYLTNQIANYQAALDRLNGGG